MKYIVPFLILGLLVAALPACTSYSDPSFVESLPVFAAEGTEPSTEISEETYIPATTVPEPTETDPIQVPTESEPPDNIPIVITIAGDCLLASFKGYGAFSQKALEGDWAYFFSGAAEYFSSDDFTIVNLENVLTDNNALPAIAKDYDPAFWFKAPTENTKILTSQSVEIVSLANNHCGDYGVQGLIDTQNACTEAGLLWGYEDKTVYVEKEGFRIAVICCGLWSEYQTGGIIKRIEAAQEDSEFQIVYYHGGAEAVHTPEQWRIRASHALADAGADLVIGNHPHVLQPYELYNETPIIYSMANFCFGGNMYPENRTILYRLTLELDGTTKELVSKTDQIIPFYVYGGGRENNFQPVEIDDPEIRDRVLDFMYNWTASPL